MIDIFENGDMSKLSRAVEFAFTDQSGERERRNSLIRIYSDNSQQWYEEFFGDTWAGSDAQYLPLPQQYVRGHMLSLGYTKPKWDVRSVVPGSEAMAFAERQRLALNFYFSILDGTKLVRQWGLDTAFGDSVAKISVGPPPYGITAPVAPRVQRINPNGLIRDRSVDHIEDAVFIGDLYIVSYKDAIQDPEFLAFNPMATMAMRPYRIESDATRDIMTHRSADAYAEEVVRLLDLYIPARGQLITFEVPNDSFSNLAPSTILRVRDMTVNPYELCRLIIAPNGTYELARLHYLKQLNFLANDMVAKAASQARHSKRNPMGKMGDDVELRHTLDAPDNEAIFVTDPSAISTFELPGPDQSIFELGNWAAGMFGRQAGNLETSLGLNAGAATARQTQALLGQIQSASDYDRALFETFLSNVGQKLATLIFESDTLEFSMSVQVPGTQYTYPVYWGPKERLARVGDITDYQFETVAYSTAYRSPQEKLAQLTQASQGILQWMMAAAQGAPINLERVIDAYSRAYDLVPEIKEWWSGEKPDPATATARTYQSVMPHQAGGAQVNYNSNSPIGGESPTGLGGFQ